MRICLCMFCDKEAKRGIPHDQRSQSLAPLSDFGITPSQYC